MLNSCRSARWAGLAMFVALVWAARPSTVRANELDELRQQVRRERVLEPDAEPIEAPPVPTRNYPWNDRDDEKPSFFGETIGQVTIFTTTAPFWAPRAALGDNWFRRATFVDAPYLDGHPGFLATDERSEEIGDVWSFRLSSEFATQFDDLSRLGTRVVFDTTWRVGLEAEWNEWFERMGSGRTDRLRTGELNLVHRFAQHERALFHVGAGVNWLDDTAGSDLGLNMTYGAEFYPVDPFVFTAAIDLGTLGSSTVVRLRSTVGVMLGRFEAFVGYDHRRIGGAELSGLVAGGRLSF